MSRSVLYAVSSLHISFASYALEYAPLAVDAQREDAVGLQHAVELRDCRFPAFQDIGKGAP